VEGLVERKTEELMEETEAKTMELEHQIKEASHKKKKKPGKRLADLKAGFQARKGRSLTAFVEIDSL